MPSVLVTLACDPPGIILSPIANVRNGSKTDSLESRYSCQTLRSPFTEPVVPRLLRDRQLDVADAGHFEGFTFITLRDHRVADLNRGGCPARLALVRHGAGEAGLTVLHHRGPMIDVLTTYSVFHVVAVCVY